MTRAVTQAMVEAALDKWYDGEDWRVILQESLAKQLSEMRATLEAALAAAPPQANPPDQVREIVQHYRDQWKRSAETGGTSHRQQSTIKRRACEVILAALDAEFF